MNAPHRPGFRIHRAFAPDSPEVRARLTAERIYMLVQKAGARQVRWHQGQMLTYPYPVREGHGTRGLFVGIYTINTRLEWIESDILSALSLSCASEDPDLIPARHVIEMTGLSRSSMYRYVKKKRFPQPSQEMGLRGLRWSRRAVEEWLAVRRSDTSTCDDEKQAV